MMLFTWAFPCVGLPRMGGWLAALLEVWLPGLSGWCHFRVPHFSPEGVVVISGFWHSDTGVAPGNVPSS